MFRSVLRLIAAPPRRRIVLLGTIVLCAAGVVGSAIAAGPWAAAAAAAIALVALVTLKLALELSVELTRVEAQRTAFTRQLTDTRSAIAEVERSARNLRRHLDAHAATLDRLQHGIGQNRDGVQEAKDRVTVLRAEVRGEADRLVATRQILDDVRQSSASLSRRLTEERDRTGPLSRRLDELAFAHKETRAIARAADAGAARARDDAIVSIARSHGPDELPDAVILLVTIHRSGSTLLFDVVRSHPAAYFEPTYRIWELLGLDGRRYPSALGDTPGASFAAEVAPGIGALLPSTFARRAGSTTAVEKLHPQFYDFDARAFAKRIDEAATTIGAPIHVVYGIREPVQAMWSMVEYQQRDPNWYAFLDHGAIPEFIHRSIASVSELHALVDGPVIDYTDIATDNPSLGSIGRLFGDDDVADWPDAAVRAHGRSNRRAVQSGPFVGEGASPRPDAGPDDAWRDAAEMLEAARAIHRSLRSGTDDPKAR